MQKSTTLNAKVALVFICIYAKFEVIILNFLRYIAVNLKQSSKELSRALSEL